MTQVEIVAHSLAAASAPILGFGKIDENHRLKLTRSGIVPDIG